VKLAGGHPAKPGRGPHLTYCTNVHAGESWREIHGNLERFVPAVKQRVSPDARFGVGLRLSGQAADQLSSPEELDSLRDFLTRSGLYVFTVNAFPHGRFHGARVKEQVYRPDWLEDERVAYTIRCAELLAAIIPREPGLEGSVSTVPGAFKPRARSFGDAAAMAERMLRVVTALQDLQKRSGCTIALALEPEPFCHLETIAETVTFFETHLFSKTARERVGALSGLPDTGAEAAIRRHLGVCLDACHLAVEFEDPASALDRLERAGIRVPKIQISAGLEVPAAMSSSETIGALKPFAEAVYLHQVTERTPGGTFKRWPDLPEALAYAANNRRGGDWRVHFHAPIFTATLGPFRSTQTDLEALLERLRAKPAAAHLEVETYSWDVLPAPHRRDDIVDAIACELLWAKDRLAP